MTSTGNREMLVWADWSGLDGPRLMGRLAAARTRGTETFYFEYDRDWLASPHAFALDPELQLFAGPQFAKEGRSNFGVFLDSSPDRWGRMLMTRREERAARREQRRPRALLESDFLLGVHDLHRPGALRFRLSPEGSFLDDRVDLASPPFARLRELEQASLAIEAGATAFGEEDYDRWLRMLIAPGGSLGGARPKASVIDARKHLWIAKFPSRNDSRDIGSWEMVVQRLAKAAGVEVADADLRRFNGPFHTFLVRRFDRAGGGSRIHFASAMTLLGRRDGDDASTGVSYLELAQLLLRGGAATNADMAQLWRRIVFFMMVSNTDDHLRNHGFLLEPGKGWRLSPAYDMNPDPLGAGLKLNVSEADNAQDIDLALSVARFFRLAASQARSIVGEVRVSVAKWRKEAARAGISTSERELMEPAFRLAEQA